MRPASARPIPYRLPAVSITLRWRSSRKAVTGKCCRLDGSVLCISLATQSNRCTLSYCCREWAKPFPRKFLITKKKEGTYALNNSICFEAQTENSTKCNEKKQLELNIVCCILTCMHYYSRYRLSIAALSLSFSSPEFPCTPIDPAGGCSQCYRSVRVEKITWDCFL